MRALSCLLVLVAACSQPPTKSPTPAVDPIADAGVATVRPADAAAKELPPGILARRQGVQGTIQVEERAGMRYLTIAKVVHAALPIDHDAGERGSVTATSLPRCNPIRPGAIIRAGMRRTG